MSPSWYADIELWFSKYGFDDGVMMALFTYCYNRSALHKNYVSTVADSWSKNNIKTYSDLDSYYEKQEKISSLSSAIKKKLRLSRNLTEFEEEYLLKWNIDYNYEFDIIELALKRASTGANLNFEYINKLLTDWHEHGFSSVEQINIASLNADGMKLTLDIAKRFRQLSKDGELNIDNIKKIWESEGEQEIKKVRPKKYMIDDILFPKSVKKSERENYIKKALQYIIDNDINV